MKLKKVIMLILIFMISLSLFSVVRAEIVTVDSEVEGTITYYSPLDFFGWFPKTKPSTDITITVKSGFFKDPSQIQTGARSDGLILANANENAIQVVSRGKNDVEHLDALEVIQLVSVNDDGSVTLKLQYDKEVDISKIEFLLGRLDEYGNFDEKNTTKDSSYAPNSEMQTPENPGGTTEPSKDIPEDEQEGGRGNPYVIEVKEIRDVCQIKYKKLPFFFILSSDSAEGTFLVELDEEENMVTFDYISEKREVGYVKEHKGDEPYSQIGAESVNLVTKGTVTETVPEYIIIETTELDASHVDLHLKNAFNYIDTVASSYVQHPCSYVFVQRNNAKYRKDNGWNLDVVYQFCGYNEPEEQAGFLESLCTAVLTFLGDLFMLIIKTFLGSDLTIDKIIFNEYEPVVIDLESGRGILGNASVQTVIKSMYNMFVTIAAIVYTTILLYIGVKVLFGVSTPRQGEYRKDLTNWIVGLVLLFAVPQFFKYVPTMVNFVVDYIGKSSSRLTMYTYYNLDEALEEMDKQNIGTSGEDNKTTYVERLKGLREQKEKEKEENEEEIKIETGKLKNLFVACWKLYFEHTSGTPGMSDLEIEKVASATANRMVSYMRNHLDEFIEYDSENKKPILNAEGGVIRKSLGLDRVEYYQKNILLMPISQNMWAVVMRQLANELPQLIHTSSELDEDIKMITGLINGVDLMGNMRVLAGQTKRFTYAVVWWVCIYEMIVMLCMYYRRVIVMGILITIYPLVAMTYPIDKLKDGKAQTLTNWYKEFTVNLVVQIVHAIVYIVLVQSGIKLYQANSNNWLFFLLSVLFLFPAERLMRGIFGLKGTSIKELKANAVGIAGAAATAITLGKQTGRAANEKFGITQKGKEAKANKQKAADKAKKNRDNRDKYLQGRADIKENQRKQKAAQRRQRATSMRGARRMAYNLYAKTMNAAGRARSAAYKLGNKGRKLKGQYRKLQDSKFAKYAKGTWRVARGATGMAVGAANFVTTSGTSGLGAGFVSGTSVARMVGGFKDRDRLQKAVDNRASAQTANTSQNANAGSGGSNGGSAPRTTPRVNVPPSVSGAPGPNNGGTSANSGSPQVNVNTTTTQNVNTQTNN